MPRPSKLTDETIEKIKNAIKLGTTLYRAGELAGVSSNTVRVWMRQGEKDIADGKRTRHSRLVEGVQEMTAKVASLVEGSVLHAALHDRDIKASTWWLERRLPEEYGRRDKVEVEVKQQLTEEFFDMLRERLDDETYQRVLSAVAGNDGSDTAGPKLLN